LAGSVVVATEVGVGFGHVTTWPVLVIVTTVPGSVVTCPGRVIIVVKVVVTGGRVVVVILPEAVIVVTMPGKVVVTICTEVLPGRVVV
jgi:hypothetical protein